MNSSTIVKKTLPIIIVILVIIGIAVSCSVFSKDKDVPAITTGDDPYFTVTEGNIQYSVTNQKIYDLLRNSYGMSTLKDLMDTDLLKTESNGNESFWDSVSEERIDEEIEKEQFPEGREGLTQEEIDEKIQDFKDAKFAAGYTTDEKIRQAYRLTLARKDYALTKLNEEIIEKDEKAEEDDDKYFPQSKITTKYNSVYNDGYWALVVAFDTPNEAKNALAQLDIEIDVKDTTVSGDYDKWVKISDGAVLTAQEVVEAMIKLYNTQYSYKVEGFPTDRTSLQEGVQYEFDNGKYVFSTDLVKDEEGNATDALENNLYWSHTDLSEFNKDILQQIKVKLLSYSVESVVDADQKWFTANLQTLNDGKLNYFVMKVDVEEAPELSEVESEIIDLLKEDALTSTYINTKMAELRNKYDIVIYDPDIEAAYESEAKSYKVDFKTTKKESKNVVARVNNKDYTADQLFSAMNKRYGMTATADRLNFEMLLSNPELNKVFDYLNTDASEKDRILDQKVWNELNQRIVSEKGSFSNSQYASMGWAAYIKAAYGANNEDELRLAFLYENISADYSLKLKDLSEVDEDSDLWKMYLANMNKTVDEYYNVTGYHLLIKVNGEDGNPVNPDEWTDYQIDLAKELDAQVKAYLNTFGQYKDSLKAIETAFIKAPKFLAHLDQTVAEQPVLEDVSYVFENIEVSKFKTANLSVKFEDLGSFTNADMVEEFNNAVREIWAADPDSESVVIYGAGENPKYIQTEFGFHVYVNTKTVDIEKWTDEDENEFVLPTLEQIQKYLEDTSDPDLTDEVKKAITTYYEPIAKELSGQDNTTLHFFEDQLDLDIDFAFDDFTLDEYRHFIEINFEKVKEKLVYKAHEAE